MKIIQLLFIAVCILVPAFAQPTLDYKPVEGWGALPADHTPGAAMAVTLDPQGNVWFYTRGSHPVIEFTPQGRLLRGWKEDPKFSNHQGAAHGMEIGPDGGVWLVDRETHTILKFSQSGRTLVTIGSFAAQQGTDDSPYAFNRPAGIAFDSRGNAYVADGYRNTRIAKYGPTGDYITHWGGKGVAAGKFNLVHGVTLDDQDRVYVADRGNKRIQVFTSDGKHLATWADGVGTPWNVTFDRREKVIWMCDGDLGRVLKLSLDGKVLGGFGSDGEAPGQFHQIHDLAVGADGAIYTAETVNQRIQKFVAAD